MIVDQLFSPKPLQEGGPYDLPGIDYDRPGDTPRRPKPQGGTSPRRHDDDPDFMDPDQRRLRADQARVAKANAEYNAKKKKPMSEAMLMEDPIYRDFRRVGQYISEQKLTEPEILQIFSDAETGMTDKATGANRTFAGRGKDATVDFAKDVAGAVNGVLNSIQNSTPVAAVDVAYDQATDALGDLAGGQKGAVMAAIKKYRNLVKQYPKTAGFAKAALVAIAGLATGGAGLPAIAGLTYALDSAIKGDKLSSVLGKGAGTAALAAAGQGVFGGATQPGTGGPADTSAFTNVNQMGDYTGEYVSMPDGSDAASALVAPSPELATYTVQQGDTLSQIAERFNTTVQELVGLNPQLSAASGATGGQGLNPDVIFPGQQITLPPGTPGADVYAGGVGTNADTMADIARGQVPNSAITQGMAARNAVKESIKFKIIPASKLIDQKATVLNWALNESVGRRSQSVNLTSIGTLTVFENVDRYRRAIVEYTQPGREQIPDLLRPDMPGAPVQQPAQPGMIGRGLNALDRFTSRVGGGLSNFGRQFTTGVTKEKLKMNWQQDGKPTDSDQLAAWLVTQKVPQQVVTDVFSKMGIPYTAPTTQPAAQAAAPKTGGASTQAYAGINPATKKPWTQQELRDKFYPEPAADSTDDAEDTTGGGTGSFASMAGQLAKPSTTSSTGGTTSVDQAKGITTNRASANNPNRQAATATTGTTTVPPNAGGTGTATNPDVAAAYSASLKAGKPASIPKLTATPKTMGARRTNVKKPTATNITSTYGPGIKNAKQSAGGLDKKTQDYINAINAKQPESFAENRIAAALKRPVAEMLQIVETKEGVQRIKQFVDETFVRYGAVNESAFAMRNQILEHVTQVGAQRRREHSQRVAH